MSEEGKDLIERNYSFAERNHFIKNVITCSRSAIKTDSRNVYSPQHAFIKDLSD